MPSEEKENGMTNRSKSPKNKFNLPPPKRKSQIHKMFAVSPPEYSESGGRISTSPTASMFSSSVFAPNNNNNRPGERRKSIFAADLGQHKWASNSPKSSVVKRIAENDLDDLDVNELDYELESNAAVWKQTSQSRREILRDFLTRNGIDRLLDWMQAIFSLVAVIIYVVQTYIPNLWLEPSLLILEIVIGSFFVLDYILGLYLAKKKINFICSLESAVDIITIVPLFIDLVIFFNQESREQYLIFENYNSSSLSPSPSSSSSSNSINNDSTARNASNFAVFRVVRVLRALRVLRAWKAVKFGTLGISINAFKTIFTLITLIFCGSGIFIALEYEQDIKFHQAIYFMFCTISTIGYGDYVPETPEGQMFVVIFMACTFVIIPKQVAKLRLHSTKNKLANVYENPLTTNGHLLLCGHITPGALIDFVHELYDASHGKQPLPLCILTPRKLSKNLKILLNSRSLGGQVDTIIGSYHSNFDLERCRAREAQACFIIADKSKKSPDVEDANVILGGLAFRNLNSDASLFLSVIKPESLERAHWVIGETGGALSVSFLRQQTLAANIVCPGASTLLANLVRSETLQFIAPVITRKTTAYSSLSSSGNTQSENALPVLNTKSRSFHKSNKNRVGSNGGGGSASDSDGGSSDGESSNTSSNDKNNSGIDIASAEWSYEYQWGMSHELYPLDFTSSFTGLRFSWVVEIIYQQYGCIMIGILNRGNISLNPADYFIGERDVGFVIASCAEKVQNIVETFEQAKSFQENAKILEKDFLQTDGLNSNDYTFPVSNGKEQRFKSNLGRRKSGRNKQLVATGGRTLISRAKEQRTIDAKQKRRREEQREKRVSSSLVKSPRPHIKRGSTVEQIFGIVSPPSLSSSQLPEELPKTANHLDNKKSKFLRIETKTDGTTSSSSSTPFNNSPSNASTSPVLLRPFSRRESLDMKDGGHTTRLVSTLRNGNNITMSLENRKMDDVILDHCDKNHFHGHIIACGAPKQIIYFLSRLRSKKLKRMRSIVVLHADTSTWKVLSAFPKVYLVGGSPMSYVDLDRCSVNTAYHVVFFGQDPAILSNNREHDMDLNLLSIVQHAQNGQPPPLFRGGDLSALEDFQSIMGLTCMSANPLPTLHTCHLRHTSSVRYLRPRMSRAALRLHPSGGLSDEYRRLHKKEAYFMAPSFACGRVLVDAMLDRLVSQAYFNPLIIPLFHALVASSKGYGHQQTFISHSSKNNGMEEWGNSPSRGRRSVSGGSTPRSRRKDVQEKLKEKSRESFLIHVEVPIVMIGRTFSEVFDQIMAQKKYIPIALYRAPTHANDDVTNRKSRGTNYYSPNFKSASSADLLFERQVAHSNESTPADMPTGNPLASSRTKYFHKSISSFSSLKNLSSTNRSGVSISGKKKSSGEVVDINPLPYVYTCPIPDAIVRKNDTIICITDTHKESDHMSEDGEVENRSSLQFDHLTMGVGSHKNILGSNSGNVQRSVSFEAFEVQKGDV
jgi:hypothetical protein